jgi:hypothetical protein
MTTAPSTQDTLQDTLRTASEALARAVHESRDDGASRPAWLYALTPAIQRFAIQMQAADVSVTRAMAVLLLALEDGGFARPDRSKYDPSVDRALRLASAAYYGEAY